MKKLYLSTKIMIATIFIVSIYFISSMIINISNSPEIAQVDTQTFTSCANSVTTFSMQGLCAGNKVRIVSFTCSNGTGSGIDAVKDCVSPVEAFNYAKDFCQKDCSISHPSTSPSPSPILNPGCIVKYPACPSPTPCPPNARCIRQVCDPIMICSSPSPTAQVTTIPLPKPSTKPTGCPIIFGKKICLPSVRPLID